MSSDQETWPAALVFDVVVGIPACATRRELQCECLARSLMPVQGAVSSHSLGGAECEAASRRAELMGG